MHWQIRKAWLARAFGGKLPRSVLREKDEAPETPLLDTAHEAPEKTRKQTDADADD